MVFLGFETRRFPEGTHSVADAAAAVGCAEAQIVKSLVVRRVATGEPVLVAVSGSNRLDLAKVAALLGEEVEMAPAKWIREVTGFTIGGVPPAGHPVALDTLVDEDLLRHDEVWASAGTPFDVFAVAPVRLVELTGGRVAEVAER